MVLLRGLCKAQQTKKKDGSLNILVWGSWLCFFFFFSFILFFFYILFHTINFVLLFVVYLDIYGVKAPADAYTKFKF